MRLAGIRAPKGEGGTGGIDRRGGAGRGVVAGAALSWWLVFNTAPRTCRARPGGGS